MYTQLFATLKLNESHLTLYVRSNLQGFNEASIKPWGYVELIVTFGRGVTTRAIKTHFLVVDFPSLYQCISHSHRTHRGSLYHVSQNKVLHREGLVATLHGDIQAIRRCFEASAKGLSSINGKPRTTTEATLPSNSEEVKSLPRVDTIDLDIFFSKEDRVEQRRKGNEPMVEDES